MRICNITKNAVGKTPAKKPLLYLLALLFFASFANAMPDTEDVEESEDWYPRIYASKDAKNFTHNHEWEGVYGEFELCNPFDSYGECDKQKKLSIYDCESLDAQNAICTLGVIYKQNTAP